MRYASSDHISASQPASISLNRVIASSWTRRFKSSQIDPGWPTLDSRRRRSSSSLVTIGLG